MAKRTRSENATRIRLPRESRARILGVTLLEPDEVSVNICIRAPREVLEQLKSMTAKERGEVVARGLAEEE